MRVKRRRLATDEKVNCRSGQLQVRCRTTVSQNTNFRSEGSQLWVTKRSSAGEKYNYGSE